MNSTIPDLSRFEFDNLAPFDRMNFENFCGLYQDFTKQFRAANRYMIDSFSIGVIQEAPRQFWLEHMLVVIPTEEGESPTAWSVAFRFRRDRPWFAILKFAEPFNRGRNPQTIKDRQFGRHPCIEIAEVHCLTNRRALLPFIHEITQHCIQDETHWNILDAVLRKLSAITTPDIVTAIRQAMMEVEFFPVESQADSSYQIDVANDMLTWMEMNKSVTTFYSSFLTQDAVTVKLGPHTTLLSARSQLLPEDESGNPSSSVYPTGLGFLVGGIHPKCNRPWLHVITILPDERRRGMATQLLKFFLNRTKYETLATTLFFSETCQPYEAAAFLTSCGFVLKGMSTQAGGLGQWHFLLTAEALQKFLSTRKIPT